MKSVDSILMMNQKIKIIKRNRYFNEIIGDLQKVNVTGTGIVSEEELLQYL